MDWVQNPDLYSEIGYIFGEISHFGKAKQEDIFRLIFQHCLAIYYVFHDFLNNL